MPVIRLLFLAVVVAASLVRAVPYALDVTAPEVDVNIYSTGNQAKVGVCKLSNGNMLVSWAGSNSGLDSSGGIWARIVTADGGSVPPRC